MQSLYDSLFSEPKKKSSPNKDIHVFKAPPKLKPPSPPKKKSSPKKKSLPKPFVPMVPTPRPKRGPYVYKAPVKTNNLHTFNTPPKMKTPSPPKGLFEKMGKEKGLDKIVSSYVEETKKGDVLNFIKENPMFVDIKNPNLTGIINRFDMVNNTFNLLSPIEYKLLTPKEEQYYKARLNGISIIMFLLKTFGKEFFLYNVIEFKLYRTDSGKVGIGFSISGANLHSKGFMNSLNRITGVKYLWQPHSPSQFMPAEIVKGRMTVYIQPTEYFKYISESSRVDIEIINQMELESNVPNKYTGIVKCLVYFTKKDSKKINDIFIAKEDSVEIIKYFLIELFHMNNITPAKFMEVWDIVSTKLVINNLEEPDEDLYKRMLDDKVMEIMMEDNNGNSSDDNDDYLRISDEVGADRKYEKYPEEYKNNLKKISKINYMTPKTLMNIKREYVNQEIYFREDKKIYTDLMNLKMSISYNNLVFLFKESNKIKNNKLSFEKLLISYLNKPNMSENKIGLSKFLKEYKNKINSKSQKIITDKIKQSGGARKKPTKKQRKKIRKHVGINQKTGRLNKGYKYSGKILKSGLKQIVKV
jgi:hypothetical protein